MNHYSYCATYYYGGRPCDCPLNALAPQTSDEALAALRVALAGDEDRVLTDCEVNGCDDAPAFPVVLTVYTAQGTVTVENVREDSIKREGTDLIAEAEDGSSSCPLFRFFDVQGYSTTFA